MRERQREKDAEILVLRYALVEMDRKVTELKKTDKGCTCEDSKNCNFLNQDPS
jgi:hypothetical protein